MRARGTPVAVLMRRSQASIASTSSTVVSSGLNSTLAATSSSSGPMCCVRTWMTRRNARRALELGFDPALEIGRRGLADQQAAHLDGEDHGDAEQQYADGERADAVEH